MKFAAKVTSSAAICETTAEPNMTMTTCEDNAGQMRWRAGRMMMWRKTCSGFNASAAPASNWPFGVASMPARTISQL